jgi:hypothetical protein
MNALMMFSLSNFSSTQVVSWAMAQTAAASGGVDDPNLISLRFLLSYFPYPPPASASGLEALFAKKETTQRSLV